jgi:hypothetical protein
MGAAPLVLSEVEGPAFQGAEFSTSLCELCGLCGEIFSSFFSKTKTARPNAVPPTLFPFSIFQFLFSNFRHLLARHPSRLRIRRQHILH